MTEKAYQLRPARYEDARFLAMVSGLAMRPVEIRRENLKEETQEEREEFIRTYFDKISPEKISVIQCEGKDVGRLRVVREKDHFYVGGIQIHPDYQGKGIGKAIMKDFIKEAASKKVPVKLEVHKVNEKAIKFYDNLGFKLDSETDEQLLMIWHPP